MTTIVNTTVERIELTALDKGAKATVDGLRGSVGGLRSGIDTLNGALAAVGVTVGAGAMIALAKQVIAADAALDDMAESTGASVEGLSALRRVAVVGGHDFDGLTAQIGKTIKGLRDNTEEGSKAVQAFRVLGVETRDGSGRLRDMSEILVETAKKLDQYEDSGAKVMLVQDALGRGAERYLPLLKDIAEGTDLVATTTAKQAAEAERAEKAMGRLRVTMEDSQRVLIQQYTPAIKDFLEQMSEGIRIFGGFGSALYNIGFAIDPFKDLAENIRSTREELGLAESESAYARARRDSFIGGPSIDQLRGRLEFLQFMQRQQALAAAGDPESNLDARDRMLRGGPKRALDYNPPAEGSAGKAQREAEFLAQKSVELDEMAAQDKREAWEAYTAWQVKALKDSNEVRLQNERAMFEAIDREQDDAIAAGQVYIDSEQNQLQEHYNNRLNELIRARDLEILTQEEYNERERELTYEHHRQLNGITTIALTELEKFKLMSQSKQNAAILGMLGELTAGAAVHSKKWFEVNKQVSTVNAVVKGYEAVQSAYAFGAAWGGPVGGAAMAAIAALAVGANVAAIQNTTFGGGGAVGTFSASPASGLPVAAQAAPPAPRGPDTIVNIRGDDIFSGRTMALLAERFNEFTRNGGRVVVTTT